MEVHSDENFLIPLSAIVLYGNPDRSHYTSGHPIRAATTHAISQGKHTGELSLMHGTPLSHQALLDALVQITGTGGLHYLDNRVLAHSGKSTVWYSPPHRRTLFVKPVVDRTGDIQSLKVNTLLVPLPGLIFLTNHEKQVIVAAYQGDQRPTPDTVLYRAPFANTYDTGRVCMGDVDVSVEWATIEQQFFNSVFTHDVGEVNRVREHELTWLAWEKLSKAKRQPKVFPEKWLISTNTTLAGLLSRGSI